MILYSFVIIPVTRNFRSWFGSEVQNRKDKMKHSTREIKARNSKLLPIPLQLHRWEWSKLPSSSRSGGHQTFIARSPWFFACSKVSIKLDDPQKIWNPPTKNMAQDQWIIAETFLGLLSALRFGLDSDRHQNLGGCFQMYDTKGGFQIFRVKHPHLSPEIQHQCYLQALCTLYGPQSHPFKTCLTHPYHEEPTHLRLAWPIPWRPRGYKEW